MMDACDAVDEVPPRFIFRLVGPKKSLFMIERMEASKSAAPGLSPHTMFALEEDKVWLWLDNTRFSRDNELIPRSYDAKASQ